ncbi:MAG: hypothetical protein II450_00400 [Prevotella sp.]|nr:hypothetical protein [Prevotella sp.]
MKKIFSNMKPARMAIMLILALLTVQTVQADPNTTDKTALATAISEAETYSGSIQKSNPNEAKVLASIIDGCKEVQNNADATQSDIDFATSAINKSVNQCKIAIARNALSTAISEAEEYYNSIKGKYPEQEKEMAALIGNCKDIYNNPDAIVELLEFTTAIANDGIKQIKTEVARIDLAAAISEAEEYYNSIKESSPCIASVLQNIINTAKEIKDDDKLTQSDMEFATSILEEVMKQAKDDVVTGINTVNAASRMAEKYYDLNGRRFNGKPSAKGVYINNGNKIVMK